MPLPSYDPQPVLPLQSKRKRKRISQARLPRKKKGKRRHKTSSNSFTPKSQFPSFLVNISSVEMCFDLSMKKSKMYNIIKMTQQKDGCTMSANIGSKQKSITTIKIEKFAGKTTQEMFVAETSKAIPSFQCSADGISLGLSDTRRGLQVKAEFYGRQRKQYTGILSHFANVKCKIVKQLSRKGKLIAKIKCTQKGKQRLKFKAVQKQSQSGDTCWFLNKRMVKLLNISPANYEITP